MAELRTDEVFERLERLDPRGTPAGLLSQVTNFSVGTGAATFGARIKFTAVDVSQIAALAVLRNVSADPGTATILIVYPTSTLFSGAKFEHMDMDRLQNMTDAFYYWVKIIPLSFQARSAVKNSPLLVGPIKH